jgi:hypothetical protein
VPEWSVTLIVALPSGVVGLALLRWFDLRREKRREHEDLVAAVRAVRYELVTNAAVLAARQSPAVLQDVAYQQVQLLLVRLLPLELAVALARTYPLVRLVRDGQVLAPDPVAQQLSELANRLGTYLTDHLGEEREAAPLTVKVPPNDPWIPSI